jgi:ribosomal 50S subunit-recycling heat shock protein
VGNEPKSVLARDLGDCRDNLRNSQSVFLIVYVYKRLIQVRNTDTGYNIRRQLMRLDKYLKVSRIIKRRTVANEACDSGRVMLNDKVARASAEVKVGDVIEIAFGTKAVKVKVTSVQDAIRKEDAKEMFEYL